MNDPRYLHTEEKQEGEEEYLTEDEETEEKNE